MSVPPVAPEGSLGPLGQCEVHYCHTRYLLMTKSKKRLSDEHQWRMSKGTYFVQGLMFSSKCNTGLLKLNLWGAQIPKIAKIYPNFKIFGPKFSVPNLGFLELRFLKEILAITFLYPKGFNYWRKVLTIPEIRHIKEDEKKSSLIVL